MPSTGFRQLHFEDENDRLNRVPWTDFLRSAHRGTSVDSPANTSATISILDTSRAPTSSGLHLLQFALD